MRMLPIIPVAITMLAMAIIAATHPAHAREMMLACEITGGLTLAAAIALVSVQKSSTITVFQVAFGAMTGQMMLTGLTVVIVWAMQLTNNFQAFALWLLAFYWLQLFALTPIAIRVIRNATPQGKEPAVKCL